MNTLTTPPLLSIELLANRNRLPSALLLDASAGSSESLAPFAEEPEFRTLTSRFPCLVADSSAGGLTAILEAAGCRSISVQTVFRSDRLPTQDLPPNAYWLAGRWYLAPLAQPSANQAASRALALQLVQLVCADADTLEIEAVLRRDPALSYHLLRLVNSPGMGLGKKISNFSQAILILGRAQLRRWLNLMLFASRQDDEGSAMLLALVAVRARTMELLAKAVGLDKSMQELAFMAGMFSLLGILFGLPLAEVLQPLKVSDALLAAVLEHEGELGRLLALTEAAECGDPATLAAQLEELQVPYSEFNLLLICAHNWMLDVIHDSRGGAHA